MIGLKKDASKLEFCKEMALAFAMQYKALKVHAHQYGGSIIVMKVLYLILDIILALVCGKNIQIFINIYRPRNMISFPDFLVAKYISPNILYIPFPTNTLEWVEHFITRNYFPSEGKS